MPVFTLIAPPDDGTGKYSFTKKLWTALSRVAHLVVHGTRLVARPAAKRLHTSDWKPPETCCRPWTWWYNDATAFAVNSALHPSGVA